MITTSAPAHLRTVFLGLPRVKEHAHCGGPVFNLETAVERARGDAVIALAD